MRFDPLWHQKVGRYGTPSAFGHFGDAVRKRGNGSAHDGRIRLLEGFHDETLTNLRHHGFAHGDIPILALNVVRWTGVPNFQDRVDALHKHRVPIFVQIAKNFDIGHQATRADAHDEAAFEHVIQHGRLSRDRGWVCVGQVDGARTQFDIFGFVGQPCQKNHAVGDRFSRVGHMLTDIGFAEAQLIGQQNRFSVLLKSLCDAPTRRVDGHHESAVFHGVFLN